MADETAAVPKLSYYQRHREEILRKKAEKYAATKVSKRVPRFTTIEEYRKYNSDRHKMYYERRKAKKAEQEAAEESL